jgi:large subunit ribosomal protein L21
MRKLAVIKTGGKQYLVKEGDEIIVDHLSSKKEEIVELPALAVIDLEKEDVEIGNPLLEKRVKTKVVEDTLKGDKIRVAHFKAKVRYRRVKGFRPTLTKIKIEKILNYNTNDTNEYANDANMKER